MALVNPFFERNTSNVFNKLDRIMIAQFLGIEMNQLKEIISNGNYIKIIKPVDIYINNSLIKDIPSITYTEALKLTENEAQNLSSAYLLVKERKITLQEAKELTPEEKAYLDSSHKKSLEETVTGLNELRASLRHRPQS